MCGRASPGRRCSQPEPHTGDRPRDGGARERTPGAAAAAAAGAQGTNPNASTADCDVTKGPARSRQRPSERRPIAGVECSFPAPPPLASGWLHPRSCAPSLCLSGGDGPNSLPPVTHRPHIESDPPILPQESHLAAFSAHIPAPSLVPALRTSLAFILGTGHPPHSPPPRSICKSLSPRPRPPCSLPHFSTLVLVCSPSSVLPLHVLFSPTLSFFFPVGLSRPCRLRGYKGAPAS